MFKALFIQRWLTIAAKHELEPSTSSVNLTNLIHSDYSSFLLFSSSSEESSEELDFAVVVTGALTGVFTADFVAAFFVNVATKNNNNNFG